MQQALEEEPEKLIDRVECSATYSPDDNKLRLYSVAKLPDDIYQKVRAAGFIWAPRQELFVAPAWSPERADLLLELCGEIDDEDKSLVERAEERAERFEEYSEKRADEAHRARERVDDLAGGIPLGQPIIVGHHSERHARKAAEKIRAGMERAVKLWDTANYWEMRAKGAVATAKYKELPAVRFRRIKGLEAEVRSWIASYTPADNPPHYTNQSDGQYVWCGPKGRGGSWVKVDALPEIEKRAQRWLRHLNNRLSYERGMLEDQGGVAVEKYDIVVGGQVRFGEMWLTILKLNKKEGRIVSVTTNNTKYPRIVPYEHIADYKPPTEEQAKNAEAAGKQLPIFNYPGGPLKLTRTRLAEQEMEVPIVAITKAQWDRLHKEYKGTRLVNETPQAVAHRVRIAVIHGKYSAIYLSDEKLKAPLAPKDLGKDHVPQVKAADLPREKDLPTMERNTEAMIKRRARHAPNEFDAMKEQLRGGGVKTVVADQLFPTPPEIARQVVAKLGIVAGRRALEPEAGTGNLTKALIDSATGCDCFLLTAVEINHGLCQQLREIRDKTLCANDSNFKIINEDFLQLHPDRIGLFDVIAMNPPFAKLQDVKHVKHAIGFLKPKGKLSAVMSPAWTFRNDKVTKEFRALVQNDKSYKMTWELLPDNSFAAAGTQVHTGILYLERRS